MTLVRFDEVSLEYGDTPLLVEANFAIEGLFTCQHAGAKSTRELG